MSESFVEKVGCYFVERLCMRMLDKNSAATMKFLSENKGRKRNGKKKREGEREKKTESEREKDNGTTMVLQISSYFKVRHPDFQNSN